PRWQRTTHPDWNRKSHKEDSAAPAATVAVRMCLTNCPQISHDST
ncbi:MAG: hypothetical protein ACI9G1_003368, partial [Pirellulaceae bacterium]